MNKRIISIFTAFTLVIAALLPASIARAQSTNSSNDTTRNYDVIVSGLWSGINFDLSGNTRITTPGTPRTSTSTSTPTNGNTTAAEPTANAYVALGDSVAAGVGLANPSQTSPAERRCGRTTEAYPYQVAQQINLPLIHKACSGATTRDFYTRDWSPSPSLPAQLDAAFTGGTPAFISITSGANDARWVGFLQDCYRENCATATNTFAINGLLELTQSRLVRVFNDINRRSANNPPIVVITGYYNPVSATCATTLPQATAAEVQWVTSAVNALNQTIRQVAANYSFARYASVNFSGHDICSRDSWVQTQNDPQPFHPTAEGQQAIAQSVTAAYRSANR